MCLTNNYIIEERVKLRQAAKKKSLHQQEGVEVALQYGERLVTSCGQDQVDLLQPPVQERLLNMPNLEQGCGEDHLEAESSLLWQVGDKDAAERAVKVSTVKLTQVYRIVSNLLYVCRQPLAGSLPPSPHHHGHHLLLAATCSAPFSGLLLNLCLWVRLLQVQVRWGI